MRWTPDDLARVLLGIVAIGLLVLLFVAAVRYSLKGGTVMAKRSGVKRLSVIIGQPLEVEYSMTPETKQFASGVEVARVFAYSGAVRVDVAPMLRANVPSMMENLAERCRMAEGLGPAIPF